MWHWDILTVLVLPVLLCTCLLGVGIGVAADEYHHRHPKG
jgi:hypothetical protein